MRTPFLSCLGIVLLVVLTSSVGLAQSSAVGHVNLTGTEIRTHVGAEQSDPVFPTVFHGDVRDLPAPRAWQPGDPIREIPKGQPGQQVESKHPVDESPHVDPLVQRQLEAPLPMGQRDFDTPILNFAGGGFSGVNPPDTVGDVGLEHYIQAINGSGGTQIRIYNKDTGALVANFVLQSLGSAQCANGLGDPIILFDRLADRWLLSEFSSSGNRMCVYISQTSDPIAGGWFAYNFLAPSFPDYPKYAVWSDAYYVGTNEGTLGLYAFDRQRMLAGLSATSQRLSVPKLSGFGFQMLQPADFNGNQPPPTGAPGIFSRHRDTEVHGPAGFPSVDFIELYQMSVNWTTPANTSVTGPIQVPIAEIDSTLCGLVSFQCFPQPNGVQLDPLREVVMWRLQYRNFGTHEALIGNLVTDVGVDHGGIRWFELRRTGGAGGSWTLHQEGTYSLDALNRFMGSIAMDREGNIALGYGANNSTNHPSIRYAGRLEDDPLGTLPQGEYTIVQGNASNASNRWGDYSSMNIDPVDDCTFWYTHQYNPTVPQWQTRIAKFAFDACFGETFLVTADPTALSVCAPGNPDPIEVTVTGFNDFDDPVTLAYLNLPTGVSGGFTVNPVIPTDISTANLTVGAGTPDGVHVFQIEGTATGLDPSAVDIALAVASAPPAAPGLTTPANGAVNVPPGLTSFAWNAVAGATGYTLEVADSNDFSNIVFSVATANTSISAAAGLAPSTTYFWRVRPDNVCGDGALSAVFSFTTTSEICSAPNVAIPDNNVPGVNDSLVVSADGLADGMRVRLDITHTWVGDLIVTLNRGSTTINLVNRPVSGGNCSGNDIDVFLDDDASLSIQTNCTGGANPTQAYIAGESYTPAQPLSAFDGLTLAGTWTLNVSDRAGLDTGTLHEWCLLPSADEPPVEGADLAIEMFDVPDPVQAGSDLTLVVAVENLGPDAASNVVVVIELPAELSYISSGVMGASEERLAQRGADWNCSELSGTVTCTLAGSLSALDVAPTLELLTNVSAAAVPGTIVTTASVSGFENDSDPDNNDAEVETEIVVLDPAIFADGFE
ncbi:MAG TPA: proprotein convertase P-domain-containing protein [Xanthomonadaceae bacterium]|nr:proprotein convertase P-domain-containing protein [Xanthomonadaceae bacterium]